MVVGAFAGKAVYLRDVATVRDGSEEREMEAYTDGQRAARIVIQKQNGGNTVNVIKRIKRELVKIEKDLPSDIKLTIVMDGSTEIINTINTLFETIIITFLVVMLVVFLFLGNIKSTMIVVLSIPLALLASLIYLFATGNTLTMLNGMAGIMFKQLGWIVSIIMIVSTTAALTFVPMLCSKLLRPNEKHGKAFNAVFGPINRFLDKISRGYAHIIHWAVKRRKRVILSFMALFVAVVCLLGPKVKTEYFPHGDSDRLSVTIELPRGTSQDVTREFYQTFYNDVKAEVPELKVFNASFGQASSDNTLASMQNNGTHLISANINIGTSSTRERTSAEISDVVRGICARYPEIRKAQVVEGGGGMGGASSIKVEVYGYSFENTDQIARAIQAKMIEDKVFSQVTLSRDEYTPEYQMDFDRTKLALNGLNSSTAGAAFSAAMSGSLASYYREDGDEYDIRVRYAPEFRRSVEDMENITVTNASGNQIRMKELGHVVETLVPPTIERKDRERLITVTGIIADGRALSDGVDSAQSIIDGIELPSGISTVIAGDFEDQQEMFGDMIILMVILVYMVMASQFESFLSPFVIMFSLPFAVVGVILGLTITGTALGVMSIVGVIILIGIVVKNGIVLIDYTILLQERGMNARDASTAAAKSRLRPILMTTLTTVLGMLPMALGTGEGSEMWRSLGMTVCWGLSVSTIVTLVLIPTIYCVFATRIEKRKKLKLKA